nr:unnamed protein product [Digitaria exilis]
MVLLQRRLHALPEPAPCRPCPAAQRSDVSRIMAHAFDPTRASAAPCSSLLARVTITLRDLRARTAGPSPPLAPSNPPQSCTSSAPLCPAPPACSGHAHAATGRHAPWQALTGTPLPGPARASPGLPFPFPTKPKVHPPLVRHFRRRARVARGQPPPRLPRPNHRHQQLRRAPLSLTEPSPAFLRRPSRRRDSPEQSRAPPPSTTIFPTFSDHETLPEGLTVSSSSIPSTSQGRNRRRLAGARTPANSGLADGVYELVPAAEEIAQESEVNVVHVDPSPEQEYRFEPEGKPRSIT